MCHNSIARGTGYASMAAIRYAMVSDYRTTAIRYGMVSDCRITAIRRGHFSCKKLLWAAVISQHPRSPVHKRHRCLCKTCTFLFLGMLFSGGRVFFLALSAAGQARRPSVHYDACRDLCRAPRWCSEHSTSLNRLGVAFRLAGPSKCEWNPPQVVDLVQ